MILVERFGYRKHQINTLQYEWEIIDKEKMEVIARIPISKHYDNAELKKLAEKLCEQIDQLVSENEVSI